MSGKLAVYFTFPYPDSKVIGSFLDSMGSESVDYVELGIPVMHPYYDGPKIKMTHESASKSFNPDELRTAVKNINDRGMETYALTYMNSFENDVEGGIEKIKEYGFKGVILPDLLIDYFDESNSTVDAVRKAGLHLIPFFTSSTPDSVVRKILKKTDSWIYHGIQPSTGITVPVDISRTGARIREFSGRREVIFGFGISNPGDIRKVMESGADGVAIGSMFIDYLKKGDLEGFKNMVSEIRGVLDEY